MKIFYGILFGMRNVANKFVEKMENTHFMFSNFFLLYCAVYEIMWKNMVETHRPQMTVQ
jgi:hypothetical protein